MTNKLRLGINVLALFVFTATILFAEENTRGNLSQATIKNLSASDREILIHIVDGLHRAFLFSYDPLENIGAALNGDSTIIAISNQKDTIEIWDVSKGERITSLKGLFFEFTRASIQLSPDGKYLAVLCNTYIDQSVWTESLRLAITIPNTTTSRRDNHRDLFFVFNTQTGDLISMFHLPMSAFVAGTSTFISSQELSQYSHENIQELENNNEFLLDDGSVVRAVKQVSRISVQNTFCFSPSSDELAIALGGPISLHQSFKGWLGIILDLHTGNVRSELVSKRDVFPVPWGTSIAYNLQGNQILLTGRDGAFTLFDREKMDILVHFDDFSAGAQYRTFPGGTSNRVFAISPIGTSFATQGSVPSNLSAGIHSGRHGIAIKDLFSGKVLRSFVTWNHSDVITSLRFSPDGKVIACGTSTGGIYAWDVDSGKLVWHRQAEDQTIKNVQIGFFQNTNQIVAISLRFLNEKAIIERWDIESNDRISHFMISWPVPPQDISPDLKLLISDADSEEKSETDQDDTNEPDK
jgi:WD40 repeat protein